MREISVKILSEDGESYEYENVMVDKGIVNYIEKIQGLMGIYTIGCCSGHIYEKDHVLYDEGKSTLGWIQLERMTPSTMSYDRIIQCMKTIDQIPRLLSYSDDVDDVSEVVVLLDPFQEAIPMDYNRVWMSADMWELYNERSNIYSLMGIDEVLILDLESGEVIGKYFPIRLNNIRKSNLIKRESEIWHNL